MEDRSACNECVRAESPVGLYANSPENKLKAREITIRELNVGYIVNVGCQGIAIRSQEELLSLLTTYIQDPKGTEEKYHSGQLFN